MSALRLVFFSSSPDKDTLGDKLEAVDGRAAYDQLCAALPAAVKQRASLEFYGNGTLKKLKHVLKGGDLSRVRGDNDVAPDNADADARVLLHIVCHGHRNKAALLFESPAEDKHVQDVERDTLFTRLNKFRDKLASVFLCACHSGNFDASAHKLSRLVTVGGAETSTTLAHPLAAAFYSALLAGKTAKEAFDGAVEATKEYAEDEHNDAFRKAADSATLLGDSIKEPIFVLGEPDQGGQSSSSSKQARTFADQPAAEFFKDAIKFAKVVDTFCDAGKLRKFAGALGFLVPKINKFAGKGAEEGARAAFQTWLDKDYTNGEFADVLVKLENKVLARDLGDEYLALYNARHSG